MEKKIRKKNKIFKEEVPARRKVFQPEEVSDESVAVVETVTVGTQVDMGQYDNDSSWPIVETANVGTQVEMDTNGKRYVEIDQNDGHSEYSVYTDCLEFDDYSSWAVAEAATNGNQDDLDENPKTPSKK